MISLEIAELVGSRHDNVKRTIETLAEKGVIEFPQSEDIPTATKPTAVYIFTGEKGKRDVTVDCLAACQSAPCKGAVFQRVRIPPGNIRSSR